MDIKAFIRQWLTFSNAYNTAGYLTLFHKDAVLHDPSVGSVFEGHSGIRKYFEDYFIGYKTQTRLIKLEIVGGNAARIEVEFTGDFPQRKIRGVFDFTFRANKIASAKADLI